MNYRLICLSLSAVCVSHSLAMAAPTVYLVPGAEDHDFLMQSYDASLPPFQVGLDFYEPGGGSGVFDNSPFIAEASADFCHAPTDTYDIQAADVRGPNPNADTYNTFSGETIDASIGGWVNPYPTCGSDDGVLPRIIGSFYDGCRPCGTESSTLINGTIHFLPFRYALQTEIETGPTGPDWIYGWIAVQGETTLVTDPDCVNICKPIDVYSATFDYVGFGIESEPNIPIIAGGGLCPADLNFDAQTDFFDVSLFLDLYTNGDPAADLNDSGTIDFFDVSEFLNRYNSDCNP